MASDDRDGDLTDQILIKGVSPSLTDSSAQVTYIVFDSANNMATVTRTVRYTDYEAPASPCLSPWCTLRPDRDPAGPAHRLGRAGRRHQQRHPHHLPERHQQPARGIQRHRSGGQPPRQLGGAAAEGGHHHRRPQLITLSDYLVYLPRGSAFDAAGYIQSVTAPRRNGLPAGQVSIESPVDTSVPGTYHVGYSVTAQARAIPSIWRWWWNKGGIVMDENNQSLQWSHIEPLCILRALARQLWMLLLAASPAPWRHGSC